MRTRGLRFNLKSYVDSSMAAPQTPKSVKGPKWMDDDVPIIDPEESFSDVVFKLSTYISKAIDAAYTYEQLRTTVAGQSLRPLIANLSEECHHPAVVAALLAARYLFTNDSGHIDAALNESRGLACELVAWQFLTFLSEKELIDYLLYELPECPEEHNSSPESPENHPNRAGGHDGSDERAPLLRSHSSLHDGLRPPKRASISYTRGTANGFRDEDPADTAGMNLEELMAGMNALEIAAIGDAKKFLSQTPVQKIVEDIWNGDVIFWESLSVHAVKKPRAYNKRVADPFTRLRVPKYQKAFQIAFFLSFLLLYYAVLVERNPQHITPTEILLYIWIAAYAYDEIGEVMDAGLMFYQVDFWSLWDLGIIGVSAAFVVTRVIGLVRDSDYITDMAFDILSMVALFLVPRIFSVMSLNPYFGSLIPVLKEMTKAFCKFMPVIIVLYLGFLTTFTMLARDRMTLNEMSWMLIKVFFGSSYLGFDMAVKISPVFGYPLMLIFVCLTNILLITSLVSLVSNSLTEVMAHAREEYLFQYSIYVLESSTSNRLTYFMPPLNLFPLTILRPLRLFFPSEDVRRIRIFVLKVTHIPFVAMIWAYENSRGIVSRRHSTLSKAPHLTTRPLSAGQFSFDSPRDHAKSPSTQRALPETPTAAGTDVGGDTGKSASGSVDNADLLVLVQKLSAQVDGLTAMVAGQQKD
ncbi:hypothetical protein HRR83_006104 [Exophiala dermatitidis]|uniref:Calcium channel YVC1-like C-terminal transmembrane domain-containing protein n=2 Tax=Exophiala dermatitidis TaxID=5970 RepID=H6BMM8_EXODN|nr:uncharacterized protein HMPREF1120_01256 [Exophiala dermatitidis NIH/UT8656]KAJ4515036.1 hypothetical protein HRR74_005501 [Exophiala dermatitidis]EHY53055.1 hypothetical protein HMPREF1120_01256 [Exophiala dermatitidis NIH/UT8656]KAJ4517527.1 hypothetical protein HRR73_004579 [Exophiala dermatitidis]KAJ4550517.1 hypothetical protein HRR78_004286 [Exophiala dermatitidis]KAJ4552564.1 hypothetical protein HRR77_002570 [Exophiala dermatitidis]